MPFNLENSGYVKAEGIYIRSGVQTNFMYSDGDEVENFIADSFRKSKDLSVGSEELQQYIYDWPSLYHLSPKRADLLRPFSDQLKNKRVLEIGSGCGAVTRYLGELGCSVLALEGSLRRTRITAERCRDLENVSVVNDNFERFLCNEKFDFVILVGVLEYGNLFMAGSENGPLAMLIKANEFLTAAGKLIIAIENKLGLKYWAGAPEDHIGKPYFNIQNLYSDRGIKTFGQQEIISLLNEAGFGISDFMYPFPDYKFADVIVTGAGFKKPGFKPLELLLEKFEYFQNEGYENRFNSNLAAYSLADNQLISQFANSFLILATTSQTAQVQKEKQILAYVHSTMRKKQYCKQTTFLSDAETGTITVNRQLLYESTGNGAQLQHVLQNEPYINGRILLGTILPILSDNGWATQDIINWARTFYEVLIAESFDKDGQAWLQGNYLDLTPFNIVLTNSQPQYFDLEWVSHEDVPAYYVFFRGLAHSLWRIFSVNSPEQGTPLQIVQLVTLVTKYYFQFGDAELNDCKSREAKYFSGVSPFKSDNPFPLLEFKIRNGDYLTLIESHKALSSQNGYLSNELNEKLVLLNNQKIAFLEETNRKQEQFNNEKIALLEELNREKIASQKNQELFERERIALVDKSKKRQQQLSDEIINLNKSIRWYADTYENRGIFGVVKEKLRGLLKKKINPADSAGNNSFVASPGNAGASPDAIHPNLQSAVKKNYYYLKPANDLKLAAHGIYITTGSDPFFLVDLKNRKLGRGWYRLRINVKKENGVLLTPKLYLDYGTGFNEIDVWNLPKPDQGEFSCLIRFRDTIRRLRFDPSMIDCSFVLNEFMLEPIGKLDTLQVAFSRYKELNAPTKSNAGVFGELSTSLFKKGFKEVRTKLWDALNYTEDNTWEKYSEWCELYDTITDDQYGIIKTLSGNLDYKPVFSIVMPVYNAPVHFLKKAIESVKQQAYPYWELCIADDKSTNIDVINLLKEYQQNDDRIKVIFRDTNGHISNASNSALGLTAGDYMVLLDQDDELTPHCLYMAASAINENRPLKLIYSDEDKIDVKGNRFDPYFKTDWNKDLFYGQNMINHVGVYKLSMIKEIGGFRPGYEGSQDYDLILRCIEHLEPGQIFHIPHILYHWRAGEGSTAIAVSNKNYAVDAGIRALNDHLRRTGQNAVAMENVHNSYRVQWKLPVPSPLVSIIIPTKDKHDILSTCITSILEKTRYENYEILVIDNNSGDPVTLAYLDTIQKDHKHVRVYNYKSAFNFSAIVNYGVGRSKADAVVLLNNDTEVINGDWLEEMVSQCMREDIGAVGAKLYYPNGQIQHAGVFLYEGHPGNHIYLKREKNDPGYFNKLNLVQEYSAVTAACLAVRRELYLKVGGFDEENLKVAYNDVDFCLKVREAGFRNLWTPFAQLVHHESLSRGNDMDELNYGRFRKEHGYMLTKWKEAVRRDPFFNPNLGHDTRNTDFAFPPTVIYEWQDKLT